VPKNRQPQWRRARTEIRDGQFFTVYTSGAKAKGKPKPKAKRVRNPADDAPIERRTRFPFKATIAGTEVIVWPDWIEWPKR
jgi:hypothetical protein